jgi:hypothetical protein
MNDDELIATLREQRGKVPMTTPVEQIISRSRALRAKRRIPGVMGVVALAAGATVTVTALVPASHPASHQPGHPAHAQLAAWTVVKEPDGTVLVTIREFRDPAGLQRRLRADGVPASVVFYPGRPEVGLLVSGRLFHFKNNPCQEYSGGQGRLLRAVQGPPWHERIRPSLIPRGAGVQWVATRNVGYGSARPYLGQHSTNGPSSLGVWLVQASPGCTGN